MKKLMAILVAALMLCSFAACGSTNNEETTTEATESTSESTQVTNPITEYTSIDEVNTLLGSHLTTPGVMGVTDATYTIIDSGDYKIGEYKFTLNGNECSERFSDNCANDISGYYTAEGKSAFASTALSEETVTDGDVMLARWGTTDGQYVFQAKGMTEEQFNNLVDTFKDASLGDNSDSAKAETYASMEGSYQDSTSQRATMEVDAEEDKAEITVHWSSGATEYTTWTMTVTQGEDGLLNYTDCVKKTVTNEGDKESETTEYENGTGYFELSEDGRLYWTGASETDCASCVFERVGTD